ncbi:MAG: hybrid sensor histidine kinase/response regulator [Phycisphaeraceae bacterium]|nr:MAG: hybrid sensor histidine kinase/response regulator [Phycisphaeraceae bacterium]
MTPNKPQHPITVILIDDSEGHLGLLTRAITVTAAELDDTAPPRVEPFTDPADALQNIPALGPVVFLCDYQMPSGTGLEWLPHLLATNAGPVILMTSSGSEEIATRALESGASRYVMKERAMREPGYITGVIRGSSRRFVLEQSNRDLVRALKHANHDLESKNTKLNTMTNTAHAFVADVAHDLRTPLSVIKEFASIIADGIAGPTTDQQLEYLRYVDSAVIDMAHMVDDFLDSAKMRAGILRVDRRPHEPAELLEAVRRPMARRALAKNITIHEHIEPGTPPFYADLEKAGRVLTNLLINAIKFSDEGSQITVRVSPDQGGATRISVEDSGRGIPAEDLSLIFNRFSQVDLTQTERVKGFGLGLSICAQLAMLNLGKIGVESTYGEGSTFSFTLPPADPTALMQHYACFLIDMNVGSDLVALRVSPTETLPQPDAIRAFLQATCFSLDIIIDAADASCFVAGVSSDPGRWIARLKLATKSLGHPFPIEIAQHGIWRVPDQIEDAIASLTAPRGAACAA